MNLIHSICCFISSRCGSEIVVATGTKSVQSRFPLQWYRHSFRDAPLPSQRRYHEYEKPGQSGLYLFCALAEGR